MADTHHRLRPPTDEETYVAAIGITDDVSFYTYRDNAGGSAWEQNYQAWCNDSIGFVPIRIKNLGADNIWGYPPGPACCQNLPPTPPGLSQAQIEALNACVPFELVVIAGEAAKKA